MTSSTMVVRMMSAGWLAVVACSSAEPGPGAVRGAAAVGGFVTAGRGQAGFAGPVLPSAAVGGGGSGGAGTDSDAGDVCARQEVEASLQPIFLAFAFDVSGSMGKGDKPWHDRTLKWDPVVRATRGFLEDAKSQGLSASMTFFPADGGDDARCEVDSYRQADVAMRALPSPDFGQALDAIGREDWRGGTPTLYVLQGVLMQIAQAKQAMPGRYAIVLVTDGYPQDCDDDSIESVASLAREHAAETPIYVMGVSNPPIDDAPDVTTNLAEVAKAGGTGEAHLIDTGDPDKTARDFTTTIESIRRATVSCNLAIPPAPAGESFDKTKVRVTYESAAQSSALDYASDCTGTNSWHYDEPDSPQQIVLCPSTCDRIQSDTKAKLSVAFECERVIVVPL